jgi:hypothetical protein
MPLALCQKARRTYCSTSKVGLFTSFASLSLFRRQLLLSRSEKGAGHLKKVVNLVFLCHKWEIIFAVFLSVARRFSQASLKIITFW